MSYMVPCILPRYDQRLRYLLHRESNQARIDDGRHLMLLLPHLFACSFYGPLYHKWSLSRFSGWTWILTIQLDQFFGGQLRFLNDSLSAASFALFLMPAYQSLIFDYLPCVWLYWWCGVKGAGLQFLDIIV